MEAPRIPRAEGSDRPAVVGDARREGGAGSGGRRARPRRPAASGPAGENPVEDAGAAPPPAEPGRIDLFA